MSDAQPLTGAPAESDFLARNAAAPGDDSAAISQLESEFDLEDPSLYFNRELSWLDFNDRVLQLVQDPAIPLLERVKFAAIYTSNLDEYFMIRVAGLQDQVEAGIRTRTQDGLDATESLDLIKPRVSDLADKLNSILSDELVPELAEHGIDLISYDQASEADRQQLEDRFRRQIFPALTPLAVGLGRPFPYISNLSLSIGLLVRDPATGAETFARVKVPKEMLPRFVPIDGADKRIVLVPMEELIAANVGSLFPGMEILDQAYFRVTRDADFDVSDEADDLLRAVEDEVRRRRFGAVVRLEVSKGMSAELRERLQAALEIEDDEIYESSGLLDLTDLWQIVKLRGFQELRDKPWTPVTQARLQNDEGGGGDVLSAMRHGDILVHHPFDSFATSVERFVLQAVSDPNVLAIKQTVYRTSDDSPLVPALIEAAERGKQAVCLVELKARFDERANIKWARKLEQAGVHVVFGLPALKTHAKCILVVRREGDGVRNYVHIGTGNYHPTTARLYTDFGLFTTDEQIGADVADMFNYLTGYGRPESFRKVLVAPHYMRDGILDEIDKTVVAHQAGKPARIVLKMNALVDGQIIRALYDASQLGVEVDLNVRGICCLRPGVPGISENIRVISVLGRFLEHSRIYAFFRGDEQMVYIGSADLMPRNLDNRVELIAPVEDANLRAEVIDTLERCLADNTGAWTLDESGNWNKLSSENQPVRSVQREMMELHRERTADSV